MVYVAAAVVVVGLLCLLDLVLTVGVIRRLREHTSLLVRVPRPGVGVAVGEQVAEFTGRTTDGQPVSRELLAERTLVGFFSPGCAPCAEELPRFVEYARSMPGGAERVLAVVIATEDSLDYGRRLAPVARVLIEKAGGPVQAAFQVDGFPALFLVEEGGLVMAAVHRMSMLADTPVPMQGAAV